MGLYSAVEGQVQVALLCGPFCLCVFVATGATKAQRQEVTQRNYLGYGVLLSRIIGVFPLPIMITFALADFASSSCAFMLSY